MNRNFPPARQLYILASDGKRFLTKSLNDAIDKCTVNYLTTDREYMNQNKPIYNIAQSDPEAPYYFHTDTAKLSSLGFKQQSPTLDRSLKAATDGRLILIESHIKLRSTSLMIVESVYPGAVK